MAVPVTRQRERWFDLAVGVAFAVFGIALVVIGEATLREDIRGDLLGPKAFPRALGVCLAVGGAFIALRAWYHRSRAVQSEGDEDEEDIPASALRAGGIMAVALAYSFLLPPVGYLLATPVFVAAGLAVMSVRSRVTLIVVPLALTAFCYYVFAEILRVPLPAGLLTQPLRALGWI